MSGTYVRGIVASYSPCIQHDLSWVAKLIPQKPCRQSRITATDHLA